MSPSLISLKRQAEMCRSPSFTERRMVHDCSARLHSNAEHGDLPSWHMATCLLELQSKLKCMRLSQNMWGHHAFKLAGLRDCWTIVSFVHLIQEAPHNGSGEYCCPTRGKAESKNRKTRGSLHARLICQTQRMFTLTQRRTRTVNWTLQSIFEKCQ